MPRKSSGQPCLQQGEAQAELEQDLALPPTAVTGDCLVPSCTQTPMFAAPLWKGVAWQHSAPTTLTAVGALCAFLGQPRAVLCSLQAATRDLRMALLLLSVLIR